MAKRRRTDNGGSEEVPSEAEILHRVALRESARQARNFTESDAIREELRSLGVDIYDKEKEWRSADGRRGTLFTAGPSECGLNDSEIQELITQREEARRNKDWQEADRGRDNLRDLGVELDDKEKTWSTSNGRFGTYSGVVQRRAGSDVSVDQTTVRRLVAERERHRSNQDFAAADDARRELLQMNVELFDNETPRVWRSGDGCIGAIMGRGEEVVCVLTEDHIQNDVVQREAARADKNWQEADSIRDELRRNGVELLERQKMWCTTDGRHGPFAPGSSARSRLMTVGVMPPPPRGAPPLPPGHQASPVSRDSPLGLTLTDASIAALVSGREAARTSKKWQDADEIREDLRSHGIEVWDKNKVWKSSDGRSGAISR